MKKVMGKCFLCIISLLFIAGCDKEPTIPLSYNVSVYNGYFEQIDSVSVGEHQLVALDTNSFSKPVKLEKGEHPFSCFSQSGLNFSANIEIRGYKEDLTLSLDRNGKIKLE